MVALPAAFKLTEIDWQTAIGAVWSTIDNTKLVVLVLLQASVTLN